MQAAFYVKQGPAREVLEVGAQPTPTIVAEKRAAGIACRALFGPSPLTRRLALIAFESGAGRRV